MNIVSMIIWFGVLLGSEVEDDDNSRNTGAWFMMILCGLSIISAIHLIRRNFGFETIPPQEIQQRAQEVMIMVEGNNTGQYQYQPQQPQYQPGAV